MNISTLAKNFVDNLNNIKKYELEKGIKKLNQKEKKFILDCIEILKGKPAEELNLKLKQFSKISNTILEKVNGQKAYERNSSLIDKFLQAIGIRISNKCVIENINGQKIDNKNFVKLLHSFQSYKTKHPNEKLSFADFLRNYGYSTEIKNINFNIKSLTINPVKGRGVAPFWGTDLFKDVNFEGIIFTKCDFESVNFKNCEFKNCEFKNCNMKSSVFLFANMENVYFSRCDFEEAILNNSKLENVKFSHSHMEYANFQQADLNKTQFSYCLMSGTNFIEATVSQNCQLNGCDLTNCLLFESKKAFLISGGKEHVITKPIIGLLWSLETPGLTATKLNRSLRTNDAIPMKYNYLPIDIDTNQLDEEVKNNLKEMKKIRDPSALSIPARLLERSKTAPSVNPQIFKLQNHAKNLLNHVDCLLLPGGSDIQPEMYGKKKKTSDRHVLESDYRRTILEFALLDEARIKGIPCMGICRGSQMGNIFYGGDLQQHVPGQTFRIQTYQAEPAKKSTGQGIIRGAMKRRAVKGVTMHHQANRRVGKELEAVIVHREKKIIKVNGKKVVRTMRIPKALENKRGAPLILMQFHPEFKGDTGNWEGKFIDYQLSEANKGFFQGFIEAANAYRKKKEVLEEIKTFQLNRFVLAKQKIEQGGELKDLKKFGAVRGIVQDETVEKVRKVFSSLDVPRSRESAQVPKSPDYEANNWDIDWENSDLQSLQQKKKLKQD